MIVHSKLPTFFNSLLVIRESTTADMCMVYMDKPHPLIVQWILYKHRNFGQQIKVKGFGNIKCKCCTFFKTNREHADAIKMQQ